MSLANARYIGLQENFIYYYVTLKEIKKRLHLQYEVIVKRWKSCGGRKSNRFDKHVAWCLSVM